jgi:hypothetical protein
VKNGVFNNRGSFHGGVRVRSDVEEAALIARLSTNIDELIGGFRREVVRALLFPRSIAHRLAKYHH